MNRAPTDDLARRIHERAHLTQVLVEVLAADRLRAQPQLAALFVRKGRRSTAHAASLFTMTALEQAAESG